MAGNKKPRKKMKARPALYSTILEKLPPEANMRLQLPPHQALAAFREGRAVADDWDTLVVRLNFGIMLGQRVELNHDTHTPVRAALDFMVEASHRKDRTDKWGLTGDAVKSVGEALVLIDDMDGICTRRERRDAMQAVLAANDRMRREAKKEAAHKEAA